MREYDDGIARLESVLGGTRANAERALRELHAAMAADLASAERRANRAERRVRNLQMKLRRARSRVRAAQAGLEPVRPGPVAPLGRRLRRSLGSVPGRLRGRVTGVPRD